MRNNFKKFLMIILSVIALLSLCMFSACENGTNPGESGDEQGEININSSSVILNVGDDFTIDVTTDIEGEITFVSMDESIATVSDTGVVSAVSEGKVSVYVLIGDYGVACEVTVRENLIKEYSISFVKDSYTLMAGDEYTLKPTVKLGAEVVEEAQCTFESENELIATVDSQGKITAIRAGETNIKVSYAKNGKKAEYVLPLLVVRNLDFVLSTDVLELTKTSENTSIEVEAYENGQKINNASYTWSTSNKKVVDVDALTGEISVKGVGQAIISACYANVYAQCQVVVYDKIIYSQNDFAEVYRNLNGVYKLGADITLDTQETIDRSGAGVQSVATVDNITNPAIFTGYFDGCGHTITQTGRLFYETNGSTIKNLTILKPNTGFYDAGAISYLTFNDEISDVTVNTTYKSTSAYRLIYWDEYPTCAFALKSNSSRYKNCNAFVTIAPDISFTFPSGGTTQHSITEMSAFCSVEGGSPTFENCNAYCINKYNTETINFASGVTGTRAVNMIEGSKLFEIGESFVLPESDNYDTSDSSVATVDINGRVTAVGGGVAVITYNLAGFEMQFIAKIWKDIASEQDWLSIYQNEATLTGNYKLVSDITVHSANLPSGLNSDNIIATEGYVFSGVIDGQNHKITFEGGRLFSALNTATVKNVVLDYTQRGSFGGIFGTFPTGVVITDVVANITFNSTANLYNTVGWECPAGGLFAIRNAGLLRISDCVFNITVNETLEYDNYYSPCYISAISINQAYAGDGLELDAESCEFHLTYNYKGDYKQPNHGTEYYSGDFDSEYRNICVAAVYGANEDDGSVRIPYAFGYIIAENK